MKWQSVVPLLVAFQCFIWFSTANPAQDDGVDLFAAVRRRKTTTRKPDCSAPCPDDTELCKSIRDPETCECGAQKCSEPSELQSAANFEAEPAGRHCMTEECPKEEYCVGSRNEFCLCEYDCCYPSCPEGQKIDTLNCPSCNNCTCLPDDDSMTTEFECDIDCSGRPECDWRIDYDACECIYTNCGDDGNPKPVDLDCSIECFDRPNCQWRIDYDACQCVYSNCADKDANPNEPECDPDCSERPECDWRIDYDACQCVYSNCETPPTSHRPKRSKFICVPVATLNG